MAIPERAPSLPFEPTTGGLIRHAAAQFGARELLVEPAARLSYAEAERLSRRLAKRLLLLGIGKGTRVAAKYPNGASWIVVWLAITRIGGLFMPLSSAYKTGEAAKCLRIGDAEFYLTPVEIIGREQGSAVRDLIGRELPGREEKLMLPPLPYLRRVVFTSWGADSRFGAIDLLADDDGVDAEVPDAFLDEIESEVRPADWMLAIFTSGSTSAPKCVIHTHGAPIRHGTAIVDINQWTADDRIFAGMPFFWVGGSCYTVLSAMLVGATMLSLERFEAVAALDLMEREGATRVLGWPGVMNALLERLAADPRPIRAFTDPLWGPKFWATGLGMSETASNHTGIWLEDREQAAGTVGKAIPFVEHRIVDEDSGARLGEGETGRIELRGYCLMAGYYKREREDTFTADGFFDTGDRGWLQDGFLHFAGRDVGLIKTAGNNVSAAEVEAALRAAPGVAQAYVVGIPDEAAGQLVGAAIVPQEGMKIDVEAILSGLRRELSAYKVPRVVTTMAAADVPFLANGKLDFRALVARVSD